MYGSEFLDHVFLLRMSGSNFSECLDPIFQNVQPPTYFSERPDPTFQNVRILLFRMSSSLIFRTSGSYFSECPAPYFSERPDPTFQNVRISIFRTSGSNNIVKVCKSIFKFCFVSFNSQLLYVKKKNQIKTEG